MRKKKNFSAKGIVLGRKEQRFCAACGAEKRMNQMSALAGGKEVDVRKPRKGKGTEGKGSERKIRKGTEGR